MKRTVALLALSAHLASLAPGAALAQAAPPAPGEVDGATRGKDLKAEGDRAIGEMRYTDALAAYDAAYRASPTFEILFNRGRAYQFLGRNPEALADFEKFAKEAPPEVRAKVPGIDKIVADVRAKVAFLTVRSSIPGANVVLGDRVIGATPLTPKIGVSAGKVVLKATATGYEPYERALELEGGGKELVIELVMAPVGDGMVRIETGTPRAVASVDGRSVGVVPIEVPLRPGDHEVLLEADGYEPGSQRVRVDAGKTKLVRFDLVEEPGVHETWWFWTGVGLLVAGGVATAIIVTREKDPPTGDFSPGQVSVANRPLLSF